MRPLRGRAVTLKWQQATKNLTLEGADKAAETLNSSNLIWALAVLGKRQRCVRMHEAGPYQRLKRTEPIAPVSTAAR